MGMANLYGGSAKYLIGILLVVTTIVMNCTEEQPIVVTDDDASLVGVVKPTGVVAFIRLFQGIVVDSTYSDSTTGFFEIKKLNPGYYSLEVTADGYGKFREDRVHISGSTALGDIYLRQIPEQIEAIIPYQDSRNISLTAPCGFVFSSYMDHNSVENAFEITPYVNGDFSWRETAEKTTIYFYPDPRYKAYTTYTFSLSTAARTVYGDTLEFGFSSNFVTEAVQVKTTNPEDGASYVSTNASVYIQFNTAMNRSSVENSFEISQDSQGRFVWHNNEAFSFIPYTFLATNTQYMITISTNAKDFYGTSINDPFLLDFTVEPLNVTTTYPLSGATNVPRSTNIQIVFNTNVDQVSVEKAFTLSPPVTGSFNWIDRTRFTFLADSQLQASTIYTVMVDTNAKDDYGKKLPQNYNFSFTTAD